MQQQQRFNSTRHEYFYFNGISSSHARHEYIFLDCPLDNNASEVILTISVIFFCQLRERESVRRETVKTPLQKQVNGRISQKWTRDNSVNINKWNFKCEMRVSRQFFHLLFYSSPFQFECIYSVCMVFVFFSCSAQFYSLDCDVRLNGNISKMANGFFALPFNWLSAVAQNIRWKSSSSFSTCAYCNAIYCLNHIYLSLKRVSLVQLEKST